MSPQELVASWPPMSDAQVAKVAGLLSLVHVEDEAVAS